MRKAFLAIIVSLAVALFASVPSAWAATDLDEILNYTIKVDVNDDATLDMNYHVEWKVLDSTKEGPLTWVLIGIPNKHYVKLESSSPTVKSIRYDTTSGTCARIDLDRAYKAGEVVSFDFHLVQDYMYEMDRDTQGETVYEFTPGWFNDIKVDNLVVKWRADKVEQHKPAAELTEDGYLTWTTSLDKGKRYKVTVYYKDDAFAFSSSKNIATGGNKGSTSTPSSTYTYSSSSSSVGSRIGDALFFVFAVFIGLMRVVAGLVGTASYGKNTGFSGGKKITRTKVVYYPECQGCGGPREEGKDNCPYCGRSFVKSEETVTEEELPPESKGKDKDGLYPYASEPNTYLRVHVIPVPVSHSSSHSSSCACACACGCACACACAGGGRAGCSTKDFYNTGLRLKQLEAKKKSWPKNESSTM